MRNVREARRAAQLSFVQSPNQDAGGERSASGVSFRRAPFVLCREASLSANSAVRGDFGFPRPPGRPSSRVPISRVARKAARTGDEWLSAPEREG